MGGGGEGGRWEGGEEGGAEGGRWGGEGTRGDGRTGGGGEMGRGGFRMNFRTRIMEQFAGGEFHFVTAYF